MLILLSVGLLIVATALLVLGLTTDSGLTLIYVSIGASVLAGIVLYAAVRLSRREAASTDDLEPLPAAVPLIEPPEPPAPPPPPVVRTPDTDPPPFGTDEPEIMVPQREPQPEPESEPEPEPERLPQPEPQPQPELVQDAEREAAPGSRPEPVVPPLPRQAPVPDPVPEPPADFPIYEYDDLTVEEVMPLLPQLFADEIGVVLARERATKNRPAILARLDLLGAASAGPDPTHLSKVVLEPDRSRPEDPVVAVDPPPAPGPDDIFPIEAYDSLTVAQIMPLIRQLEVDELADVRTREAEGAARATILRAISDRLGDSPPPRKRPAKKSAAKKRPAKKSAAKKRPAKKSAAKKRSKKKKKTASTTGVAKTARGRSN